MPQLDELVGLHRDGRSSAEILMVMKERGLTITEAIKASMQLRFAGTVARPHARPASRLLARLCRTGLVTRTVSMKGFTF